MEFVIETVHFSKDDIYVGFYVLFFLWKRAGESLSSKKVTKIINILHQLIILGKGLVWDRSYSVYFTF